MYRLTNLLLSIEVKIICETQVETSYKLNARTRSKLDEHFALNTLQKRLIITYYLFRV